MQLWKSINNITVTRRNGKGKTVNELYPCVYKFYWPDGKACLSVELYLLYKSNFTNSAKNHSVNQIASSLSHLVRFCFKSSKDFLTLHTEDLIKLREELVHEREDKNPLYPKRNNKTINGILQHVIDFIVWLAKKIEPDWKLIASDSPDAQIELIATKGGQFKLPKRLPITKQIITPISSDFILRLHRAAMTIVKRATKFEISVSNLECNYFLNRYKLLLKILEESGARIDEITSLTVSDAKRAIECSFLSFKTLKQIEVKERAIPISDELIILLDNWVHEFCNEESEVLFVSFYGKPLSKNTLQRDFHDLRVEAGLNEHECHPHQFRHRFITILVAEGLKKFIEQGVSISNIKNLRVEDKESILGNIIKLSGHSTTRGLEPYIHLGWKHLNMLSTEANYQNINNLHLAIELTLDELKFFSDLESVSRSYLTNKLERLYKILGKNKHQYEK